MKMIRTVCEIEKETFSDAWSEEALEESLKYPYNHLLLITGSEMVMDYSECPEEETIAGYLLYSSLSQEAELLRIAIRTELRGRGYGSRLFRFWLEYLGGENPERVFLEVRAGNQAAIHLYKKYGFEKIAGRKDYYKNPVEDACVMQYIYQ